MTTLVRSRLREWGVHPRKRYGQHFLISRPVLERISEAADLQAQDTVLEIGAGLGDLTELMASMVRQVTALEFDPVFVSKLLERFESVPNVKVLHEDALHWPLPQSLPSFSRPLKVVGNLPYNVATQILMRFSQFPRNVDLMVLMLQKEVAERLVAKADTRAYGGITLMLQLDWDLMLAFKVSPAAFHPRPKVESAVVVLRPLPVPRVDVGNRRLYRELVRAAFAQRRKTLRNALKGFRPSERGWSDTLLSRAGIEGSRRAETLCVEEYARLSRVAQDLMGDWGEQHDCSKI